MAFSAVDAVVNRLRALERSARTVAGWWRVLWYGSVAVLALAAIAVLALFLN